VYGGTVSYSIYMTHALVHKGISEITKLLILETAPARTLFVIAILSCPIIIGCVTYHLVERPANLALRGWMQRRSQPELSPL